MNKEGLYLDQEKKQVVWTMPIETVKEDELTWNMLQNNSIDGFLELEYYCIDDKMCLCYPYQNLQSVCSYLEKKKADLAFFRLLFENIAKLMESGASFLLPEQGYLLDIEMIFIDHVKKQVKVCYLPGQKDRNRTADDPFGRNIIRKSRSSFRRGYPIYLWSI